MVVSFKSAGGFIAQKLFLQESGIDVFKELKLIDGKRQEEVILNVYRKNVDAGFVRESALDVLKEEIDLGKIHILARTPYIANWPFAATRSTDKKLIAMVQKSLLELKDDDVLLMGKLIHKAKEIAAQKGIQDYRLVINNGRDAGQAVFHIHLHLLSGRAFAWPPG